MLVRKGSVTCAERLQRRGRCLYSQKRRETERLDISTKQRKQTNKNNYSTQAVQLLITLRQKPLRASAARRFI